jgi:hypothetical protein
MGNWPELVTCRWCRRRADCLVMYKDTHKKESLCERHWRTAPGRTYLLKVLN